MPPLLRASQRGDCASIRVLHASGADVHARSGLFGRSALALAAERGHPETCRLLLELGADASATDMGGRTPLQMATGEAAEVLLSHQQAQEARLAAECPQTPTKGTLDAAGAAHGGEN
jgi:ankyrin repeat protein